MGRKIEMLFLSVLLTLIFTLPVKAESTVYLPVSTASACYTDGSLIAYVNPETEKDVDLLQTGVMIEQNMEKKRGSFMALKESNQPVRYMLLLDLSTSMPQYKNKIQDFIKVLVQEEALEYQITVAGFGKQFEILEKNLTDADSVQKAVLEASYSHKATDIGRGIRDALEYLSGKYNTGEGPFHLILFSDGIPYLSDQDKNEKEIRETAKIAEEAIAHTPEIIVHSVGFSKWNPTMFSAVSTGSGLDLSVYSAGDIDSAAKKIVSYADSLYVTKIPFSWDYGVDRVDLNLVISKLDSSDIQLVPFQNVANVDLIFDLEDLNASQTEDTKMKSNAKEESEKEPKNTKQEEPEELSGEKDSGTDEMTKTDSKGIGVLPVIALASLALLVFLFLYYFQSRKKESGIAMKLEVISGHCNKPKKVYFLTDQLLIGSSSNCDVIFKDQDIAPESCRIFIQDQFIYIENMNTERNMISVEGMKIYTPKRLRTGDEISIGNVRFLFRF